MAAICMKEVFHYSYEENPTRSQVRGVKKTTVAFSLNKLEDEKDLLDLAWGPVKE